MVKTFSTSLLALALTAALGSAAGAQAISTGFDDVSILFSSGGWLQRANGGTSWGQGIAAANGGQLANAQAPNGSQTSFIETDTNSPTVGIGNGFSTWLITPEVTFTPGGTFSFYTRGTQRFTGQPGALEIRVCTSCSTTNLTTLVGSTPTSLGLFTGTPLRTIGSTTATTGSSAYPGQYDPPATPTPGLGLGQISITGLPTSGTGRIAFRFFGTVVDTGGGETTFATIAVDTLSSNLQVVPEPTAAGLGVGVATLGLLALRRRRTA